MQCNEAPLMTAKICHDLATPLSAMSLLIDLAFENSKDPYIEATFRESLEKATLKLQFFRSLLTINSEQPLYSDVHAILTKSAASAKVRLMLPAVCPDGSGARLLLGLTHILIEGLIRGGSVHVEVDNNVLRFTAEGDPLQLRPGYKEALMNIENVDVNARNILPVHLSGLARSMMLGIKITTESKQKIVIETVMKD
ncbi:MAG: histidine phosphotransferase family protein [Candidatus Paracaedibacteraceae bacterium]|nr:histidine phosphotransferase family protein [Candidatus Paracaedibacteraceae bacterium]